MLTFKLAVVIENWPPKGSYFGRLQTNPCESWVHPLGEEELDFKFLAAGGPFQLRGSDEALTADGSLVAGVGLPSVEPRCACPQEPGRPHTEAIKSRYELRLTPAKRVLSARRKIIKLAAAESLARRSRR
jgi:hypothetical protein